MIFKNPIMQIYSILTLFGMNINYKPILNISDLQKCFFSGSQNSGKKMQVGLIAPI